MSNASDFAASADSPPEATSQTLCEVLETLPFERYAWRPAAISIHFAGALYPVLVGLMSVGFALVSSAPSLWKADASALEFMQFVVVALIYTFCGALIGFIWSAAVCLVVLPIAKLFARSLRIGARFELVMAICGGLVGFIAVIPLLALLLSGRDWEWEVLIWVLPLGPGLATILGQLGGAMGARREVLVNRAVLPPDAPSNKHGPLQFGTRKLQWTCVWVSVLLTAFKLTGAPLEFALAVVTSWIVFQTLTLYVGWIIATKAWPRWHAWRSRRRST